MANYLDSINGVLPNGEPPLSNFDPRISFSWHGTDSKELFDKHMDDPRTRAIMEKLGHTRNSVIYELDAHGFRNPRDIVIHESYLGLGCSFTFGTGLPATQLWTHYLGNRLGANVYNAGLPGSSGDTAFRVARTMVPMFKPKGVFILVPEATRMEIISDFIDLGEPHSFGVWDYGKPEFGSLDKLVSGEVHTRLQQDRNVLAIEALCNRRNIPFFKIYLESVPEHVRRNGAGWWPASKARDLGHYGFEFQEFIAIEFHKMLQK